MKYAPLCWYRDRTFDTRGGTGKEGKQSWSNCSRPWPRSTPRLLSIRNRSTTMTHTSKPAWITSTESEWRFILSIWHSHNNALTSFSIQYTMAWVELAGVETGKDTEHCTDGYVVTGTHAGPLNWTKRRKRRAVRSPRSNPWSTQLPNCTRKESFWKLKACRPISMILFLSLYSIASICTND